MSSSEPLNLDVIRHRIDQLTVHVPLTMTRTDIVTWFMINYLAGARDAIMNPDEMVPRSAFPEGVQDDDDRHAVAAIFTDRIRSLASTTSWSGGPP